MRAEEELMEFSLFAGWMGRNSVRRKEKREIRRKSFCFVGLQEI